MRSLPATAPSVRTYGVSDTAPTRKAQVHSAMLWTPFLLALIGLVFQFSVGITDLLRPNKDGAFPDLLTALRPALMQGAWFSPWRGGDGYLPHDSRTVVAGDGMVLVAAELYGAPMADGEAPRRAYPERCDALGGDTFSRNRDD